MTGPDDNLTEQSNKRPRIDKKEASRTAAQRFFNTPELVNIVLPHLSKDRIDLLALSLASKALRNQALQVWVRELDIPVQVARNHLNFFKANPTSLEHVRYLRLRHDHKTWNVTSRESDECCNCDWHALNELLDMIARRSASTSIPPMIDLRIYASDLLDLPAALSQQVVSLHIRDVRNCNYDADSSFSEGSSDSGVDGDGDQEANVQDPPPRLTLGKLAEMIQNAQHGPGLRSFGFDDTRAPWRTPSSTMQQIWAQVVQHAPTLRYLNMERTSYLSDFLSVFSKAAFVQLEELRLRIKRAEQPAMVDHWLNGAENLRSLVIMASPLWTSGLRSTFPRLRQIKTTGLCFRAVEMASFAVRHPNVVCLSGDGLMPSETATVPGPSSAISVPVFYPKLAHAYIDHPPKLQAHHDAGRSFAQIVICLSRADKLEHYLAPFLSNRAAAERLTFLEIDGLLQSAHSFCSQIPSMLDSVHLPNLSELHLSTTSSWQNAFGADSNLDTGIGRLMAALTSARSLRVIRFRECARSRKTSLLRTDILRDAEFPPAFEYFCLQPPNEDQLRYFRFVSSHPDARIVTTESGGKRGRLQRLPGTFRQRITKEGVWLGPFNLLNTDTVLDHLNDVPSLSFV
ncbi:hypothetical protein OC845_000646 [Tilletia horrida]|nr:hypothetical protein OC845_000646 [Tilletia horrida]